jgi:hypothetical protein
MDPSASLGAAGDHNSLKVLWEDSERVFCKLWRDDAEGDRHAFTPVLSGAEHPTLESVNRLAHEYELKDYLDGAWALRPVELVRERGRTMLVVEYSGGEPLDRLIRQPMEIGRFLRLAVAWLSHLAGSTDVGSSIRTSSQRTCSWNPRLGKSGSLVSARISPTARAPVARTSRVHRRNARLYGARANGTSESLYRFPQRPLLTWNHLLRNADRQSSVHGIRSRWNGCTVISRDSPHCPAIE